MDTYKLMINHDREFKFHELSSALDYMSKYVQRDSYYDNCGKNHYELIHEHNDDQELIFEFPKKNEFKVADLQPLLRDLFSSENSQLEDYLHDITHNLHKLEELEQSHFTVVEGNNSNLDIIRYADLTEYSIMYCQTCKKLQHITVEGCEGVLLFVCDECDQIISEVYRVEEQINIV